MSPVSSIGVRKLALLTAAVTALGCHTDTRENPAATTATTPSASVTASASSAAAKPAAPENACKGPTGTVKGVIRIVGDEPPSTPFTYPKGCEAAAGTYGKLFRRGQDGQLADAIVTVSEYTRCKVPIEKEAVELTIKDCALSTRSVVLTHGQHIAIKNLDPLQSYLPRLDGARAPAMNVAVPRGPEVKVYTRGHGRYWLDDQMGMKFMLAHVWHLPYSTAMVTGLDGRYEIKGVPLGKAKLSVMLPQTKTLLAKNVEIVVKEGDNEHDIELVFDAAKDTPVDGHGGTKPRAVPAAPKTSATPSAPAP